MKIVILPFIPLFIVLSSNISLAQGSKNSLQLDGHDDHVFFDYNNRGITNEVTVETWVKTSATKLQLVTAKYNRDQEHGYQLVMRDGKAAFSGRDGSGEYRISGYSPRIINDNQWHHLAGVCKDGTWSIYIDGVLENQSVTGYSNVDLRSNAPFTVGNYYLVNNDFFQGQIDELKIWKKGLSEFEIRSGMCQTADKANSDLVVYLKFDEGSGSTLIDHSSYKINGTFKNMSASNAWVVSGAPIGDQSVYRYTNKWDSSLELTTTNVSNFSVLKADPTIKGFHLYKINSPPAQIGGISNAQSIDAYYGIFKVGDNTKKYKVYYKNYALTCGSTLYRRADNTVNSWQAVADTVNSPVLLHTSAFNYGEFVITSLNAASKNTEVTAFLTCNDKPVTLQALISQNAVYLWSNGQTSQAIQVTAPGTYSVTTTTPQNCPITTRFMVYDAECPIIPNIITPNNDGKNDTFVIGGLNIDNIDIEIFNRWGKSIYKTTGYDNTWATKATGIYYYHIKSRLSNKDYKGWIEVIK